MWEPEALGQVVGKRVREGTGLHVLRRMHQHPGRLVHREHLCVLKKNLKRNVFRRAARCRIGVKLHLDDFPRAYPETPGPHLAIHPALPRQYTLRQVHRSEGRQARGQKSLQRKPLFPVLDYHLHQSRG